MMARYRAEIAAAAATYALDAACLAAQVQVESGGDPFAFRYEPKFFLHYIAGKSTYAALGPLAACSYGLLQIMYVDACELGFTGRPEELFAATVGLEWGARKMRSLLTWTAGDLPRALCAYNGGRGAVLTKPYRTQAYADKVYAARTSLNA